MVQFCTVYPLFHWAVIPPSEKCPFMSAALQSNLCFVDFTVGLREEPRQMGGKETLGGK